MVHFAEFFERAKTFFDLSVMKGAIMGSKRSRPPGKIPRNAPLYVLPHTRKITSRTFKIRGTLVFLCPKERESERVRERKSEREIE
jgi:hypothetical protein